MTRWPDTREAWDAAVAAAKAKYAPLVAKLPPAERVGLMEAVREGIAALSAEAHAEDIRRGHRPPGTSIGRAHVAPRGR